MTFSLSSLCVRTSNFFVLTLTVRLASRFASYFRFRGCQNHLICDSILARASSLFGFQRANVRLCVYAKFAFVFHRSWRPVEWSFALDLAPTSCRACALPPLQGARVSLVARELLPSRALLIAAVDGPVAVAVSGPVIRLEIDEN